MYRTQETGLLLSFFFETQQQTRHEKLLAPPIQAHWQREATGISPAPHWV